MSEPHDPQQDPHGSWRPPGSAEDTWRAPGGPTPPGAGGSAPGPGPVPSPPPPPPQPAGGHPGPPPGQDGYTPAPPPPPTPSGHGGPGSGWAPGVVPLMPLTMSDMFSGAARTMRNNPGATIGLGFLVAAAAAIPTLLLQLGVLELNVTLDTRQALLSFAPLLFSLIASQVLSGLIVRVVAEAALGTKMSIGEAWAATRPQLLRLIGLGLVIGLITGAVTVIPIGLAVFLGLNTGSVGAAVFFVLVGFGAALVLLLLVTVKVVLAPAALVLEELGVGAALRRGWRLTGESSPFWRVFGIHLLTVIIVGIVSAVISGILVVPFVLGVGIDEVGGATATSVALEAVVGVVTSALFTPFFAGVICLLYLDQRIRREGLDITMMAEAQRRFYGPQA